MPITTALITAAGYGSRFFPVAKSVQKEMLPVLNRPVLDYLVDDCIKAGITNIVLTIREGQNLAQHYYTEQPKLRTFFAKMGTPQKYATIETLHQKAKFTFVLQNDADGYGTGIPVQLAEQYLKDEPAFLYLTGDDFCYQSNDRSEAADLIQTWEQTQAAAVVSCREVPLEETYRYGIIETSQQNGFSYMKSLVEKPKAGTTSAHLANISKYVLTPAIFPILKGQSPDQSSGEIYITDTLIKLAKESPVAVHVPKGEYLDCGNVAGWLIANLRLAKDDPKLWHEIQEFLAE